MKLKIICIFLLFNFLGCSKSKELSEESKKKFIEAKYLFSKMELSTTLKILEEIIHKNQTFLPARIMRIKTYYYLKKLAEAYKEILFCENNFSENGTILLWKAKIISENGDKKKAIEVLSNLTGEDPYNFRAHFELAKLYKEEKKFIESRQEYYEALSIEPILISIRLDLMEIFIEEKNVIEVKDILSTFTSPYKNLINNNENVKNRLNQYEKIFNNVH